MFEVQQAEYRYQKTDDKDSRVSIFGIELGHVLEVHAVPAGDQGQRTEDRGDDGKDRQDVILFVRQVGFIVITDLGGVIDEGIGHVEETGCPLAEETEITDIFFFEELVLILFQFLRKIDQMVIVCS